MNWYTLCEKWNQYGYGSLTAPEQIWICTRMLIDAVNDGGLVSYFYNHHAEYYDDTRVALRKLQAFDALHIFESFGRLFGDTVPKTIDERNKIINSWPADGPENSACKTIDTALAPLLDVVEKNLNAYLIKNGIALDD